MGRKKEREKEREREREREKESDSQGEMRWGVGEKRRVGERELKYIRLKDE